MSVAARIRQLLALALIAHHAWTWASGPWTRFDPDHFWFMLFKDPATPAFLLLALLGVGLRLFWGRYLAICFSTVLFVAHSPSFYWYFQDGIPARELLMPLGHLAVILLLSGKSMAAFYEQRPSRFNRWAGADPRITRLRFLILCQALFLGFAYAGKPMGDVHLAAILVLGGFGLLGLVFLKTWSLVALAVTMLLEGWIVLVLAVGIVVEQGKQGWGIVAVAAAVLAFLLLVSVVLAAPFYRRMLRQIKG